MSTAQAFQGIQVLAAALALVAFIAGWFIGESVSGISLTGLGLVLFTIATAAALAVVAIRPSVLTGTGRSRPL